MAKAIVHTLSNYAMVMLAVMPGLPVPQVPRIQNKYICTRDHTVSQLANTLDLQRIVHVRGTPACGKTTLALLLANYYDSKGGRVFYLPSWKGKLNESDPWNSLAERVRTVYGLESTGKADLFVDETVLLLDEAQDSYEDDGLWNQIIKDIVGRMSRIKLCLFCSYGSPSTGLSYNDVSRRTPVTFGPYQRVSLTPSTENGAPQIGLFYTRDEFEEVFANLCDNEFGNFLVEPHARNYIFDLTNGHPGAVVSLAYLIFQVRATLPIMLSASGFPGPEWGSGGQIYKLGDFFH